MIELRTSGETPSKKNSRVLLKNGRNIPSAAYRKWHEGAVAELLAQRMRAGVYKPLEGPVSVSLAFTHGDLRRRDGDNGASSILDTLVDAGVLSDDNWNVVREINVINRYDKNNARCDIAINDYKENLERL